MELGHRKILGFVADKRQMDDQTIVRLGRFLAFVVRNSIHRIDDSPSPTRQDIVKNSSTVKTTNYSYIGTLRPYI